jgi:hypothetical protein
VGADEVAKMSEKLVGLVSFAGNTAIGTCMIPESQEVNDLTSFEE